MRKTLLQEDIADEERGKNKLKILPWCLVFFIGFSPACLSFDLTLTNCPAHVYFSLNGGAIEAIIRAGEASPSHRPSP